jgi:hypothetical protein
LPFYGFAIEPLRLMRLRFSLDANGRPVRRVPEQVTILVRLSLADDIDRPLSGGNLVQLTLAGNGDKMRIAVVDGVDAGGLQFVFTASERRVVLTGKPAWSGTGFGLSGATLSLPLFGQQMLLKNVVVASSAPLATSISWPSASTTPAASSPPSGQGQLRITKLSVEIDVVSDGSFSLDKAPTLTIDSLLEINATSPNGDPAGSPVIRLERTGKVANFYFLGAKIALSPEDIAESDRAIVVTKRKPGGENCAPFAWMKFGAPDIALMLAASVGAQADSNTAVLPLGCGRCEGEVRQQDGPLALNLNLLRFRAACQDPAKTTWRGFISVSGQLKSDSAIGWPRLKTSGSNGRRTITRDVGNPLRHAATYLFDEHHIPFGLCAVVGEDGVLTRPWTVFAAVQHAIRDSVSNVILLQWTGVEALAIATDEQLIPKLGTTEAVTFGARYRNPYKVAASSSGAAPSGVKFPQPDPTMLQPGIGALKTVLEGILGSAFRTAYWQDNHPPTVIAAAGFLGATASKDKDEQPLLKLPFLVGLMPPAGPKSDPPSFGQTGIPVGGIAVGWADSGAAHGLVVRSGAATAPVGTREADVSAAVRAGALFDDKGNPPSGDILAAQLVEQVFRDPRSIGTAGTLDTAPYWLGAAVTVSGLVAGAASPAYAPLSVVAGSIAKGKLRRGTAAVLHGPPDRAFASPAARNTDLPALLISGELNVAEDDWTGPSPQDGSSLSGYAFGLARAHHVHPLFAVVRAPQSGLTSYTAAILPKPISSDLPAMHVGSRAQAHFAEGARGYAVSPGTSTERWLTPVLEGRTAAVRDDKSGLAGLGRALALPTQASEEVAGDTGIDGQALARKLVWFTEKRIPVYQPLDMTDVQSPPLFWLEVAPPRARLPADADVDLVLRKAGLGPNHNPPRNSAQAFLPDGAGALTVSERAGVITARRTALLGVIDYGDGKPRQFDPDYGRFGRPAQTGSSVRRWLRTPRPGIFPANKPQPDEPGSAKPETDRRPEASPLLPQLPLRFLVGPADTIRGTTKIKMRTNGGGSTSINALWSATFIASPGSDGIVSDLWDGSVRLRVELDIACKTPANAREPEEKGPAILARLLFPSADRGGARSYGSVIAGGGGFALHWMTLGLATPPLPGQTPLAWMVVGEPSTPTEGVVQIWRTYVDLVLDPNEAQPVPSAVGAVHAGLAAAISSGASTVELRFTVYPGNATSPIILGTSTPVPLTIAKPDALAFGDERPPVTLRWSLPAVSLDRGGMPLVPATALFVDPSYEASLANPPNEKALLIDTSTVADAPKSRGAARLFFWTDRPRVNRRGSIAFMADIRFERPPALYAAAGPNGDVAAVEVPSDGNVFVLSLQLFPAALSDKVRYLWLGADKKQAPIKLATVYELSLGSLVEDDGSPAKLTAGDVLQLSIFGAGKPQIRLWNSETSSQTAAFELKSQGNELALATQLTLTDEPVVEPPSALYAALSYKSPDTPQLTLPLYAQSPLPWRVDFRNLKQDFRDGLVRHSATFVWGLARPLAELGRDDPAKRNFRTYIVKVDRNGQTYLPEGPGEFMPAERPSL